MATAIFTGNTQSGSPYWGGFFRVDLSETNQSDSTNTSRINWATQFYFGNGYSTLQNGHLNINGVNVWNAAGIYHFYNSADLGQTVFLASGFIDVGHNPDGTKTVNVNGGTSLYNSDSYQSNFTGNFTLDTLHPAPSAPGTPVASGHNDSDPSTVTLSWSAPTQVGTGLTGRGLQLGTASDFGSGLFYDDGTGAWETSHDFGLLAKNTTYYCRVSAKASNGIWGPYSAVGSFTTGSTVPGAPGTPTFGTKTYTSIDVSWAAPSDTGGRSITSYTLEYATSSSFSSGFNSISGLGTSTTVTGLSAGTTYYFRVKAINSIGTGVASATRSTSTTNPTAPDAPDQPTFSNVGGTSLTVSWGAPANTNGAAITSYRVEYSTSSGFGSFTSVTGITSLTTQVTGLAYGQTYYFRVKAVNSAGTSVASTSNNVTMGSTTPDAPAAPTTSSITQTTVQVSFSAPAGNGGSAITSYDIQCADDSGFTANASIFGDDASPYVINGLVPATTHYVRVRAVNANGPGTWSAAVSFQTVPAAYIYKNSTWVACQLFAWNGATWVPATTQKWSGSAWV